MDSALQGFEGVATLQLTPIALSEHHQFQAQQPMADPPGLALKLGDAVEVAQQMRPADLVAFGHDVGVSRIAIAHDRGRAVGPDDVLVDVARPRGVKREDG